VKNAIEIGRLLTDQKASLAHGEWIPWIESNLVFGRSQAANYMRAYRERDTLNVHPVAHLKEAVALLAEPREEPDPDDGPDIDPDLFQETEDHGPDPKPKIVYQADSEQAERQKLR
jgi:hypothetical protein